MRHASLVALIMAVCSTWLSAQSSHLSEISQSLVTYPYSDPDPVAKFGTIYPYFSFDGYTDRGMDKQWKMIVMENDYIKLWVTPEIGGKIWGALDKKTGKEFIYFNHAVKFRSVAMRGPWTSGGIELNFGVIGHAPTCSSPVDYYTRINPDSSLSCYVGAMDLPSRTEWVVEIRLPKDRAEFLTRVLWYNGSPYEQSYYQWMNAAEKVSGNLEYVYPGAYYLGHDGRHFSYPVNENGKDLSFYNQNNFGPAKSYHVAGIYTGFYGGYWHDDDFGFGHYANYDEKPGKKIWIWGLSRSGMIWENLLTDHDGQYTEIQSGRLFNQSAAESSETPFKHRTFYPDLSDFWSEFWFPVHGTGGLIYSSPDLAFNLIRENNEQQLAFYAIGKVKDSLKVYSSGHSEYERELTMNPGEVQKISVSQTVSQENLKIILGHEEIYSPDIQGKQLSRPNELPAGFDFNSVNGLFLQGKEWERQRMFDRAKIKYNESLEKDPYYVPALSSLAGIDLRELRLDEALKLVKIALAVDAYDPYANYLYGLINLALGRDADALDGLSIATQSADYREAAYTQLAEYFVKKRDWNRAGNYLTKCLLFNKHNLKALQMSVMIARLQGNSDAASRLIKGILQSDPLNHFARFERYMLSSDPADAAEFNKYIRNELPHETYLELAINYYTLNRYGEALKVLDFSPVQPMIEIWKAYITFRSGYAAKAIELLNQASRLSPAFVFPFRQEDVQALKWASGQIQHWKFDYYLALALSNFSRKDEALSLLMNWGNKPDFYPFYSVRSGLQLDELLKEKDLIKACETGEDWRPGLELAAYYGNKNRWKKADSVIVVYDHRYPANYSLGVFRARCLLNTGRYEEGLSFLSHLQVLPSEGASEGRNTWRATSICRAIELMEDHKYKPAIGKLMQAKQWPENLGVGRPYDPEERLENFLLSICYKENGDKTDAGIYLDSAAETILAENYTPLGASDLVSALALKLSGRKVQADQFMQNWVRQFPENQTGLWCNAVYSGHAGEALKLAGTLDQSGQNSETNGLSNEVEFRVIQKYISFFLKLFP